MKKLAAIFYLLFLFLLAFPLVTNQLIHHSLATPVNEAKTFDQLAKEAWEHEVEVTNVHRIYKIPLKFGNFINLRRLGINGINSENNNLLETVKEKEPFKIYAQLSSAVKAELKNLVQIPNWEAKMKNLYLKTRLEWKKNFWNKIRKKYLDYLKRYKMGSLKLKYYGVSTYRPIRQLFKYNFDTPFENLSFFAKNNALPDSYTNGWELSMRKKINIASGSNLFLDAKAIWENTLCSSYLPDLKKYQIREISGVEIAGLLTLTRESEFVDFTFHQQDQIHNLVDLPNYLVSLKTAISQKRQEEEQATIAFWNNSIKREKIKQFLNYDLFTIANVSLNQLTSTDFDKPYLALTNQQQEQLKQLLRLKDYEKKITTLLEQEKTTERFWTTSKSKIKALLRYQLLMIDDLTINQFNLNDIDKAYLALKQDQKIQLRKLVNLEDYASKIALLLSEEQQAADFWASAINKKLLAILFQASLTMLGEIKIDQLNKDSLAKGYFALTSEQKEQIKSLSKLTNFSQAVQQAVVKTKVDEKKAETDQLPLILGLSLGLSSLLLVILFSYLYWKKRKKKVGKNLSK